MRFTAFLTVLTLAATVNAAVILHDTTTLSQHLSKRSPGKDFEKKVGDSDSSDGNQSGHGGYTNFGFVDGDGEPREDLKSEESTEKSIEELEEDLKVAKHTMKVECEKYLNQKVLLMNQKTRLFGGPMPSETSHHSFESHKNRMSALTKEMKEEMIELKKVCKTAKQNVKDIKETIKKLKPPKPSKFSQFKNMFM
ncbi:hypothetical protein BATDEDRAFT_26063 [Batrachochytrium dendrobatidis JAM81]|uniref:Uncharacterized protein n=1 Tax=Batrachochytrium dendrobatidis (strain JAM81 / FGSC 10211) TaxID=684364 RepID=F4P6G3_BATDJ|nr:uncharacterized protein BATDEDRAFT_26063 [Batrachochytrium dendrobatidis JAM81]EGF79344.1 hypothetical protein BATDEDRAFT_26063 [Batrachochytrium dendrobatidis JAM81]|eukprot:XP_006679940.1 hypothetical protein BATDEDRAFT_26063 [Batrachochytrium dendrobatidis JAM81]